MATCNTSFLLSSCIPLGASYNFILSKYTFLLCSMLGHSPSPWSVIPVTSFPQFFCISFRISQRPVLHVSILLCVLYFETILLLLVFPRVYIFSASSLSYLYKYSSLFVPLFISTQMIIIHNFANSSNRVYFYLGVFL